MPKFRKKPVVIDAVLWDGIAHTANTFIGDAYGKDWWYDGGSNRISIPTLEGNHVGNIGDWIIKGVAGEFYPCKPEIFDKTYKMVEQMEEPVFSIKASDIASEAVLRMWIVINHDMPNERKAEVLMAVEDFRKWKATT